MIDPAADLLPEGLEDRLPQSAAAAARIERAALEKMDSWGYDRVRPPLIEFEKSMAERMDGFATRRMFRFVDPKSLRTLALRADMTVQVGRIGSLLGESGINIGTFHLGRRDAGGEAVLLLSVDQPIPPEVIDRACELEGVKTVKALAF